MEEIRENSKVKNTYPQERHLAQHVKKSSGKMEGISGGIA
jgi:hypothetical protein